MSISTVYVHDQKNVMLVLEVYCGVDKPTARETAALVGTTEQNVLFILATNLTADAYMAEKALRYSRSKMGGLNHMLGKSGSQHHNHKGDVDDGYGYLQRKVNGKYVFVHRIVMAELLGLDRLPNGVEVHHIDGNKHNNSPDNLAIVTPSAHRRLHGPLLRRSSLWERWASGTLKLLETTPT